MVKNGHSPFLSGVSRISGRTLLVCMIVLQLLDIITTVIGLGSGFREANPIVFSMIRMDGLRGLLLSKVLAVLLAGYFLYSGRLTLLRRVTVLMGLLVFWNVFWLATTV